MLRFAINLIFHPIRSLGTLLVGIVLLFVAFQIFASILDSAVNLVHPVPAVIIALLVFGASAVFGDRVMGAIITITAVGMIALPALHVPNSGGILWGLALCIAISGLGAHGGRLRSIGGIGRMISRRARSRGARFARRKELHDAGFLGTRGWPVGALPGGRIVRLPSSREREGVIAVAPTGSYKTSALAIPALLSEAARPEDDRRSLVIGDPKDELTRLTRAALARTHRVHVWDPGNPAECTVGFDPLATLPPVGSAGFLDELRDLSDSWFWATRHGEHTSDPFFITQPQSLMRAAILVYVDAFPGGTFIDMGDWIRGLTFDEFIGFVEVSRSPYARAFGGAMRSLAMNDRAVGGIWADVQQRFDVLDTPKIRAAMTSANPIDWEAFVAHPTALYVRVAARDSERLQSIVSLFFARMYRTLGTIAGHETGRMLPRDVRIIIDEFGNLERIYGIETALATLRSAGVGHYLFVQSTSQITRHYGKVLAQTIQDSLVTKLCLGGAADEDSRWFSARCGERITDRPTMNYTAGGLFRGNSANFSHTTETRPLVTAAEIMHMSGEVLMSTRGVPPVRARLRPHHMERQRVGFRRWSAGVVVKGLYVYYGLRRRLVTP